MKRVLSLTIITLIISSLAFSFLKMRRQALSQENRDQEQKRSSERGFIFFSFLP